MNNLSSYCGLVDAKIRASDKDLPVLLGDNFEIELNKTKKNHIFRTMVGTRSDVRDLCGQTFSEDFEGSNLASHYPEFGCRRGLPRSDNFRINFLASKKFAKFLP